MQTVLRVPDRVVLMTDGNYDNAVSLTPGCAEWNDVHLAFDTEADALRVRATASETPLCFIRLRWDLSFPAGCRFLGDTWERSYADLEWRGMSAARAMPWYFLASADGVTAGYGVRVRPGAMCFWQADPAGVTLWLDVRCGGEGVLLSGRTLNVCEVVSAVYEGSAFSAAQRFCRAMCPDPLHPAEPVYGSNNWYYAYGFSSHDEILSDTDYLSRLTKDCENRPFMVIDDGWQYAHDITTCNGGPWDRGNEKFPDMPGLAGAIVSAGCRPGIWVRLLLTTKEDSLPESWRLSREPDVLDPSLPEVLDFVRGTVRRLSDWGYRLIKHDFSTFDIFGRWGFEMNPFVTAGGWHFADRSRTSAEIIVGFYRAVLEGANGAYVLGCNCVGHLGAGLMHLQRTGDDTSGKHWERTRLIGPNTLAFRMPQHRAFFDIDADCVGVMGTIPWEKNRQWTGLLAKSTTPLFVSAKPGLLRADEMQELSAAMVLASRQEGSAEPLDWMDTTCPAYWRFADSEARFSWYEENGLFGFGFDIK